MQVLRIGRDGLRQYVLRQLQHHFPDGIEHGTLLDAYLDEALVRLSRCIDAVRPWTPGQFDYLHSTQYCQFLYYLSHTIWRRSGDTELPTRLFLLNKALNAIDCFYEIELPERFYIGHSAGIVLAKAHYGDRLVLYQHCTVGKNHGVAPVIDEGVVLFPDAVVIGRSHVRAGSVLSQGCRVVNRNTPGDCLVFGSDGGGLHFKPIATPVLSQFFRD
jgi:serine O-acetyltransferase